jgi:hypothetical protein
MSASQWIGLGVLVGFALCFMWMFVMTRRGPR